MNEDRELRAFYFSHDIGACSDPKLVDLRVRFGWKAIGMFWAIVEALHKEESGTLPVSILHSLILDFYQQEESREMRHIAEESKDFEDCLYANALLLRKNGNATSKRVIENLKKRKNKSDKAKESAMKRWHKPLEYKEDTNNATVMQRQCKGNAKKERKEKKKVLKPINKYNNNNETHETCGKPVENPKNLSEIKTYIEKLRKDKTDEIAIKNILLKMNIPFYNNEAMIDKAMGKEF